MSSRTEVTWRAALRYVAWWSPLVLLYTFTIGSNGKLSVPAALQSALYTALSLTGRMDGDALVLRVSDDGPNADPSAAPVGTGVGLEALRKRLVARYGSRAHMDVESAPGRGFIVTLRLPT